MGLNIQKFIDDLAKEGISLSKNGNLLQVKLPNGKKLSSIQRECIKENKEVLLEYVSKSQVSKIPEICYPLSPLQQGILFHCKHTQPDDMYMIQLHWSYKGKLNTEFLKKSWSRAIQKFDVLRSNIVWQLTGLPNHSIFSNVDIVWKEADWSLLAKNSTQKKLESYIETDRGQAFDYENDFLLRLHLIQLDMNEYFFMLTTHHVILDGWSLSNLLEYVNEQYIALLNGDDEPAIDINTFKKYTDWLKCQDLKLAEPFWKELFYNTIFPTNLPINKKETAVRVDSSFYSLENERFILNKQHSSEIKLFVQESEVTLNSYFQLLWSKVLAVYSGNEKVVYGITVSGRNCPIPKINTMVGMFINTLPIVVKFEHASTVASLLRQIHENTNKINLYAYTPLSAISSMLEVDSNNPLFTSLFVYENYPFKPLNKVPNLTIDSIGYTEKHNYPISISIMEQGDEFSINISYNTEFFDRKVMLRLKNHLLNISGKIVNNPTLNINSLSVLSNDEVKQIIKSSRGPSIPLSDEIAAHQYFEQQTCIHANAVAVSLGDDSLSYSQLNEISNQLARYFLSQNIKNQQCIAYFGSSSFETLFVMLASMKIGAIYLPIDGNYPINRVNDILEDSRASLVVTKSDDLIPKISSNAVNYLNLDLDNYLKTNLNITVNHKDLAYMIYTSGSTGSPKGVVINHLGTVNHILSEVRQLNLYKNFDFIQSAPLSSDISIWQFLGPIMFGGSVLLIEDVRDIPVLFDLMKYKATVVELVPSHVNMLIEYVENLDPEEKACLFLKWLIITGETLPIGTLKRWFSHFSDIPVVNAYGPSEASDDITQAVLVNAQINSLIPPIGKPIDNTSVYVLDANNNLLPEGIPGEICVAGYGVSPGYYSKGKFISSNKFIKNPITDDYGDTLYKTGDIGYWHDGQLYFVGRKDNQIKLSGYRVELEEIESLLNSYSDINRCLLRLIVENSHSIIVAYCELRDKKRIDEINQCQAITQWLRQYLPEYMLPQHFIFVKSFVLLPSGKIDSNRLPPLVKSSTVNRDSTSNNYESLVYTYIKKILNLKHFDPEVNLFRLGCSSINIMQIASYIRQNLNCDVSIKDIYGNCTGKKIASLVSENQSKFVNDYIDDNIKFNRNNQMLPISCAQEQLWFLEQFQDGKIANYNIPIAIKLEGKVKISAINYAVEQLVKKHELLSVIFKSEHGKPKAEFSESIQIKIDVENIEKSQLDDTMHAIIHQPFDLAVAPLYRFKLYHVNNNYYVFLIVFHHIIADGWSIKLILNDIGLAYKSQVAKKSFDYSRLDLQYLDYANLQRKIINNPILMNKFEHYWQTILADAPYLQLPYDYPKDVSGNQKGDYVVFKIPNQPYQELKQVAIDQNSTLYCVLLTIFHILLSKYSNQHDFVIGSVVSNRIRSDYQKIVGLFVNPIALRISCDKDENFASLLKKVTGSFIATLDYQHIPFDYCIKRGSNEESKIENSLDFYNVFMTFQDIESTPDLSLPDITVSPIDVPFETSKFDLTLSVTEHHDQLIAYIEYNSGLFSRRKIEQMGDNFNVLIQSVLSNIHTPIYRMSYIEKTEYAKLINETSYSCTREITACSLQSQFLLQVSRYPNNIAISYHDIKITYAELDVLTSALSKTIHTIINDKASRIDCAELIIGVCCQNRVNQIVSILAIIRTGAAYLALDPDLPAGRIIHFLTDSKAPLLLVDRVYLSKKQNSELEELPCQSLNIDELKRDENTKALENDLMTNTLNSLAYVIYTSGSTGQAKGVMIEQKSILNLVLDQNYVKVQHTDRIAQVSNVMFDAATFEIWSALLNGAECHIFDKEDLIDYRNLKKILYNQSITHLFLTTAMFNRVVEFDMSTFDKLKYLLFGGELVNQRIVNKLLAVRKATMNLVHVYGPTENTTFSTYFPVLDCAGENSTIPIGRPITNTRCYVLDSDMQIVPSGNPGMLYLSGSGVARGYINDNTEDGSPFLSNPFCSAEGKTSKLYTKIYKTNDIVRYRFDGKIEFIKRNDQQLKIRGYRIEPGEIETIINSVNYVKECIVLPVNNDYLVAYSKLENGCSIDEARIKLQKYSEESLPYYMVPAQFIFVDHFPLTKNGKIDKELLLKTNISIKILSSFSDEYETYLASVMSNLLNCSSINATSDFFELGGHSLLATQLASRIEAQFNIPCPIKMIFRLRKINKIADYIRSKTHHVEHLDKKIKNVRKKLEYVASHAQKRLWILSKYDTVANQSNNVIIPLKLAGKLNINALIQTFESILKEHDILRTTFKMKNKRLYQMIHQYQAEGLKYIEGNDLDVHQIIQKEIGHEFNLEEGPLCIFKLYKLKRNDYLLLVNQHHIITDGWSIKLLFSEICTVYNAFNNNEELPIKDTKYTYVDYSEWQNSFIESSILYQKQCEYWKEKLSNFTDLALPTDNPRPTTKDYRGETYIRNFNAATLERIKQLSLSCSTTKFITALVIINILLSKYTNQTDIIVGTPIANRNKTELENILGYLSNTLVLRNCFNCNISSRELFSLVTNTCLDAYSNQDVPFEKIIDLIGMSNSDNITPIFQVMLLWQDNRLTTQEAQLNEIETQFINFEENIAKYDLSYTFVEYENNLDLRVEYDISLFTQKSIVLMVDRIEFLLQSLPDQLDKKIRNISIINPVEKNYLLNKLAINPKADKFDNGLLNQIRKVAYQHSNDIAVVFGSDTLMYKELSDRSDILANCLYNMKIGEGCIVGIYLKASINRIITLLAIMKTGAAYLPVDESYPQKRVQYMFEHAKIDLITSESELLHGLHVESTKTLLIDTFDFSVKPGNILPEAREHNDPIYVLYTSGSTGRPKGAILNYGGVENLLKHYSQYFKKPDKVFIFTSFGFDLTQKNIFSALLVGAQLHLSRNPYYEPDYLRATIKENGLTVINCTPSAFYPLLEANINALTSLRIVFLGGEPILNQNLIPFIENTNCRIVNTYGPTECSDLALIHEITHEDIKSNRKIPLGSVFPNVEIYVLGNQKELVPVGIPGELYIGGRGLGLGYIHNEGLNKKIYSNNPFRSGKLYKTGDVVKFSSRGFLEFLGRNDHQIKLRGNRIECGEVENHILALGKIKNCLVNLSNILGKDKLVAYCEIQKNVNLDFEAIKEELRRLLPLYMVPSYFVKMEKFPLTPNGKVDRSRLPVPEIQSKEMAKVYKLSNLEKILSAIVCDVLNIKKLNPNENLFNLGLDSILTIQISSRAQHKGYSLKPKNIFENPTIFSLAKVCKKLKSEYKDSPTPVGAIKLSPIQHWFFEQKLPYINHFNQSILLKMLQPISYDRLQSAINTVCSHHDMLNARFEHDGGEWSQAYNAKPTKASTVDIKHYKITNQSELIDIYRQVYSNINIFFGPILTVAFIEHPKAKQLYLLFICHHLVIDTVSWQILFNDIASVYLNNASKNNYLLRKTASYQQWTNSLFDYQKLMPQSEIEYWRELVYEINKQTNDPLLRKNNTKINNEFFTNTVELNCNETAEFFNSGLSSLKVTHQEILLAALLKAHVDVIKQTQISLYLEGHGRNADSIKIDSSRTIGWFTSLYPIIFEVEDSTRDNWLNLLTHVKSRLRGVPNKGIGFGIMRYLKHEFQKFQEPRITFNYLGRDVQSKRDSMWETMNLYGKDNIKFENIQEDNIDINIAVLNDKLMVNFSCNLNKLDRDILIKLQLDYLKQLAALIKYVNNTTEIAYTSHDFPLATLNQNELEKITLKFTNIENIYPLAPLQLGILFHKRYDTSTSLYFEQLVFKIRGNFNSDILEKAFQKIISKHTILRTCFFWNGINQPHQIVLNKVNFELARKKYPNYSDEKLHQVLKTFCNEDINADIDLRTPPLLRGCILTNTADQHYLVISFSHIILDGWSISLFFNQLLNCFKDLLARNASDSEPDGSEYAKFIDYLQMKNSNYNYWKEYLKGFLEPNRFLIGTAQNNISHTSRKRGKVSKVFNAHLSNLLTTYAAKNRLTINTIIQASWAVLLHYYTQSDDIVFGVTTSGRPPELEGVETMLGVFINTIPMRAKIGDDGLLQWMHLLQKQQITSREYGYLPLVDIQKTSSVKNDLSLFESIIIFENFPIDKRIEKIDTVEIELYESYEHTNYSVELTVQYTDYLETLLYYDLDKFSPEVMEQFIHHFSNIVNSIVEERVKSVSDIELLSSDERKSLLKQSYGRCQPVPQYEMLHHPFHKTALNYPNRVAITDNNEQYTYDYIDRCANELAVKLIKQAVEPRYLVGVLINNKMYMLTAILGILKIGAVYVPLDPSYPDQKIRSLLEDSQLKTIITDSSGERVDAFSDQKHQLIDIRNISPCLNDKNLLPDCVNQKDSAYMIYTSGSTGKSKGVLIHHLGAVNHILSEIRLLGLSEKFTFMQTAPVSSDMSIWQYLGPSFLGGTVVIPNDIHDIKRFIWQIEESGVNIIEIPPVYLMTLLDYFDHFPSEKKSLRDLEHMIVTADTVPVKLVNRTLAELPQIKLTNAYGPSEASDDVCQQTITTALTIECYHSPIGTPIDNMAIYILSNNLKLLPENVIGEICISGIGIALGYFADLENTQNSFIKNPYSHSEDYRVLYKTGDYGYWNNGILYYYGRKDNLINLNGFRFSITEIENIIMQLEPIHFACVKTQSLQDTEFLVAYYELKYDGQEYNHKTITDIIVNHLKEYLPGRCIPKKIVRLDNIPLLPTGKIDRQNLPDVQLDYEIKCEESMNEFEKELFSIWSDVFGQARLSKYSNFFEIGGDSIVALMVANRAMGKGINVTPKDIFENPTINQLANMPHICQKQVASNEMVSGIVELLPIQRWFFEKKFPCQNHYNQAVLIRPEQEISLNYLVMAFQKLILMHDTLRIRFKKLTNNSYQQFYSDEKSAYTIPIESHCLNDAYVTEKTKKVEKISSSTQASLDIENGPLMRCVVFKDSLNNQDSILIVVHHLIIDMVSFLILVDDLEKIYNKISMGDKDIQYSKSNSLLDASLILVKYAKSQQLQSQIYYWNSVGRDATLIRSLNNKEIEKYIQIYIPGANELFQLMNKKTSKTTIEEVLLTSLVCAFHQVTDQKDLLIAMESHGRTKPLDEINLSRTLGWFTNMYPVHLKYIGESNYHDKMLQILLSIKNSLRGVPEKGIGYGVLKYLSNSGFDNKIEPQISFNYIGELLINSPKNHSWQITNESCGEDSSLRNIRPFALDITAYKIKNQITLSWCYKANYFTEFQITSIKEVFYDVIEAIRRQLSDSLLPYSVYDFPLTNLNCEEIERIWDYNKMIVSLYPLSPMQKGMFFHHLYGGDSTMYFEQFLFQIKNLNNLSVFQSAWQSLVDRHTVLRTGFIWSGLREPMQYVLNTVELPISTVDFQHYTDEECNEKLQVLMSEDRNRGIDLSVAPCWRLVFIKKNETDYLMLWSYHHTIIDGWSLNLLLQELLKLYESEVSNKRIDHDTDLPQYESYIKFLLSKDQSKAYWKALLHGYQKPFDCLVGQSTQNNALLSPEIPQREVHIFSKEEQHQLMEFVSNNKLTPNTLVQGAWAILLLNLFGCDDIIYGITTSGRPAAINNVDRIAGLFINTLPQRAKISDQNIIEWLSELQTQQLLLKEHEHTPLYDIQSWSDLPNDESLFDTIIVFQNMYLNDFSEQPEISDLSFKHLETFEKTNYSLELLVEMGETLSFNLIFGSQISNFLIKEILCGFVATINNIIRSPKESVNNISIYEDSYLKYLIDSANGPLLNNKLAPNIVLCFEKQVLRTPYETAIVCDNQRLDYQTLNSRANQLASHLIEQGVKHKDLVAILLDRSIDFLIAMMGILKCGATYVPIDVSLPNQRINYMLSHSKAKCVITSAQYSLLTEESTTFTICVDDLNHDTKNHPNLELPIDSNSAAYVIYTSGSTGVPKAVAIHHSGALNHIEAEVDALALDTNFVFMQTASVSSDISVWQFLGPILLGGKVIINKDMTDFEGIINLIHDNQVTLIEVVPSFLQIFVDYIKSIECKHELISLCYLMVTGEVVKPRLINEWLSLYPKVPVINAYGPSEASDDVCQYIIDNPIDVSNMSFIPIGQSIANMSVFIVNDKGMLLPKGLYGEIAVSGVGVGLGYYNDPAKTSERFIKTRYADLYGETTYLTGDVGYCNEKGEIVFVGRRDQQIQVRGFRVELEEVELSILQHTNVARAAIVIDVELDHYFYAFVVVNKTLIDSELYDFLKMRLPSYMLPNRIIFVKSIPYTTSGKVDKLELLKQVTEEKKSEHTLAGNVIELKLAEIWCEVLSLDKIYIEDNFFNRGGHSLYAVQIILRINQYFKINLPVSIIFEYPTIQGLYKVVEVLVSARNCELGTEEYEEIEL